MKTTLMDVLGAPADKVRVVTGQVGGSFGMKAAVYPEYICILHGARALGRPVKWTDERSGSFVSDQHGRAQDMTIEVAFDDKAHITALRLSGYGDMGGYLSSFGPLLSTGNQVKNIASVYRTPLIEVATKCVFTTTTHVSAYRGAGRPEGNYYVERVLDVAASEMGIDRLELRKRNMIRKSDLPFKAASGMTYDTGDFLGVLKQALEMADYAGFKKRKRESKKRGLLRGIGIGCYLEVTAGGGSELGAIHFNADGGVTIVTGTMDFGMGHATTYAQILSEKLGVPFERIRTVEGDSDAMSYGNGSGGSRSVMYAGAALTEIRQAGDRTRQADRVPCAGSLGKRHRIQGRTVHHRRHRPLDRPDGTGRAPARRAQAAGRRAQFARRRPRRRTEDPVRLPQRLPYRRGGSRSRHRRGAGGELFRGQRPRHRDQSAAGGRPDPGRRDAGPRPGAAGTGGL